MRETVQSDVSCSRAAPAALLETVWSRAVLQPGGTGAWHVFLCVFISPECDGGKHACKVTGQGAMMTIQVRRTGGLDRGGDNRGGEKGSNSGKR